jgi:glycerol uptake facilitator-like aquaporin
MDTVKNFLVLNEVAGSFFFCSTILRSGGDTMKVAIGLFVAAAISAGAGFNSAATFAAVMDGSGDPQRAGLEAGSHVLGAMLALRLNDYLHGKRMKAAKRGGINHKALVGEFLGTMILALAAAKGDSMITAMGLYVAANMYAGDFNPAVTMMNFVNTKKGNPARVGSTVLAQILGWRTASFVASAMA